MKKSVLEKYREILNEADSLSEAGKLDAHNFGGLWTRAKAVQGLESRYLEALANLAPAEWLEEYSGDKALRPVAS